jgi:hypothetical protein
MNNLQVDLSNIGFMIRENMSDFQKNLLCGGFAGCLGKTVTAPLNRITIIMQVNSTSVAGSNVRFGNMMKTAIHLWKVNGLKSFWKGNLTMIIHRFPYSAINFSSYEILRDRVCQG